MSEASTPGRWCTAAHTHAGTAIQAQDTGCLCRLKLSGLQHAASEADCTRHLHIRPRSFVSPDTVLATACARKRSKDIADIERNKAPAAPNAEAIRDCFVLDAAHSHEPDPHFGLTLLSVVALRALSPSGNDAGTASAVMAALTKLVVEAARARAGQETGAKAVKKHDPDPDPEAEPASIGFGRLTLPEFAIRTVAADGFSLITRDGASMLEVGIRLQKMLTLVARHGRTPVALEARLQARKAMERGRDALSHPDDRRQLEALRQQLFSA